MICSDCKGCGFCSDKPCTNCAGTGATAEEKFAHLRTERRFDLANGPWDPFVVTLCSDPRGALFFEITSRGEGIKLGMDAIASLTAILAKFKDAR